MLFQFFGESNIQVIEISSEDYRHRHGHLLQMLDMDKHEYE